MNQYLSCIGYGIKQTETTFYLPFRSAFPVPERCRGRAKAGRVAAASEGFPCRFGTNSEGTYNIVCLALVLEKNHSSSSVTGTPILFNRLGPVSIFHAKREEGKLPYQVRTRHGHVYHGIPLPMQRF